MSLYELVTLCVTQNHTLVNDKYNTDYTKMMSEVAWLFPELIHHNKVHDKFKILT